MTRENKLSEILKQGTNGAIISEDEMYRYALWRVWDEGQQSIMFIMLNPSTADASKDDATIRKCIAYAKSWGYGGIFVCNLYAYRSRDPKMLEVVEDPVGPLCDEWLAYVSSMCPEHIAGWGNKVLSQRRVAKVISLIDHLNCLELSKSGNPKHPLYLRKTLKPCDFPG